MKKLIIMHTDDAPWIRGGAPGKEVPGSVGGGQLVGDLEQGPWIHVNWLPAGHHAKPHSHSEDEIMYIVEGGFSMGKKECRPGTVLFIPKNMQYGFKVGPNGVKFLNIRHALAKVIKDGKPMNPYTKPSSGDAQSASA